MTMSKIDRGEPDAKLFEIPRGYKRLDARYGAGH
jgi:hypothetical protein